MPKIKNTDHHTPLVGTDAVPIGTDAGTTAMHSTLDDIKTFIGAEPAKGADDNYVTDAEKIKLGNLSGTNTGDQDLTALNSHMNTTDANPHGTNWDQLELTANHIPMDLTPTAVPTTEGTLSWNPVDHCLNVQTEFADAVLQVGQEQYARVVNKTGSAILDGTVVYINGAQGNRPTCALAIANTEITSLVIGVATQSIINNAEGYVTTFGLVRGFSTAGFAAGDLLYLSATVAGTLTNVKPIAPYHAVPVAIALNTTSNGLIYVKPQMGFTLHDLHDVLVTGNPAGQILKRNATNTLWENKYLSVLDVGFESTEIVWDDVFIDGLELKVGNSAPTFAAFMNGVYALRFNNNATDEVHGSFELRHGYKEGTDLEVHIHWSPDSTDNNLTTWGLEYTVAIVGSVFPATTTVTYNASSGGVADAHLLTTICTISGTSLNISSVIHFRLFRNGSTDAFTGNAFLHRIGVHYQVDTIGSTQQTAK